MQKLIRIVFLLALCTGIGKLWHAAKDGFQISRVRSWNVPEKYPISEEAKKALCQSYRYIGRGHQCYAFASEDGQYVLKLPRTDRYQTPFWMQFFPEKRKEKEEDVQHREKALLESFRISYEELSDQTALLAFRMGSGSENLGNLQIQDRLGRSYVLPVHQTPFLLQRKFPILMRCFESALDKGKREEAAQILDRFLEAIYDRAMRGVLNKDPSFMRNFGYDGTKAYQIDVGSFYRKEGIAGFVAFHRSIKDTIGPVRQWLKMKDPDLEAHLDEKLHELLRGEE